MADAFVATAIATVVALVVLMGLGVITPATDPADIAAKLIVQVVPASAGAILARSQLGSQDAERDAKRQTDVLGGAGLVMLVGAPILMMPLVTTVEVMRLAFEIDALGLIGVALATMGLMHVIV